MHEKTSMTPPMLISPMRAARTRNSMVARYTVVRTYPSAFPPAASPSASSWLALIVERVGQGQFRLLVLRHVGKALRRVRVRDRVRGEQALNADRNTGRKRSLGHQHRGLVVGDVRGEPGIERSAESKYSSPRPTPPAADPPRPYRAYRRIAAHSAGPDATHLVRNDAEAHLAQVTLISGTAALPVRNHSGHPCG